MKHAKKKKTAPKVAIALLVVVCLCAGGFFAFSAWRSSQESASSQNTQQSASTESNTQTQQAEQENAAVEPEVHYVAIIGADTWHNKNGSFHLEGSDLQMVMRIDVTNGVISLLTLPRDVYYDNTKGGTVDPGASCSCDHCLKKYTWQKSNYAFHYGFYEVWDKTNYDEAVTNGAEACVDMMSDMTGLPIEDYALIDIESFENLVNWFGGVTVDVPLPITNYTFYSGEDPVSINYGTQVLDGWLAMVATRARVPYTTLTYSDEWADGWHWLSADGATVPQDASRQALNRRVFTSLMDAGLALDSAGYINSFVDDGYIKTTLSAESITAMYNAISAHRGLISVHLASVFALDGVTDIVNGTEQWLIPYDETTWSNVVNQFKNGESMTTGYAYEDKTL